MTATELSTTGCVPSASLIATSPASETTSRWPAPGCVSMSTTAKEFYEKVLSFDFLPQTLSDWLIHLTELTNQVALHWLSQGNWPKSSPSL